MNYVQECKRLGLDSRIVACVMGLEVQEVGEIEGESLREFHQLNQIEESGLDKWLKLAKGREYDGDEVMLDLMIEIYKKLDRLEAKFFQKEGGLLHLSQKIQTHHIGHGILCFDQELKKGGLYYGRIDLPIFPSKMIPFYAEMLTDQIAQIIKMGVSHTRSYDSYVVECERMEIRAKRKEV